MDFAIMKDLSQFGIVGACFIWLLFTVMKTNAEREKRMLDESKDREERLHQILEQFGSKYDIIVDRLEKIEDKIKE